MLLLLLLSLAQHICMQQVSRHLSQTITRCSICQLAFRMLQK
jgi:hypothetical protein